MNGTHDDMSVVASCDHINMAVPEEGEQPYRVVMLGATRCVVLCEWCDNALVGSMVHTVLATVVPVLYQAAKGEARAELEREQAAKSPRDRVLERLQQRARK